MKKVYLVFENSLFHRTVFCLKEALTIGTDTDCDVQVQDENMAAKHAHVSLQNQNVVVKDLGSRWGTYQNDHRIDEQAVLSEGDHFRCGGAVFQIQNDLVIQTANCGEVSSCRPPSESLVVQEPGSALNVRRLEDLIPRIPLFTNISASAVSHLARNSRLLFYEAGQVVFHQGDTSKSLFIILDGCIEVTFRDNQDKDIRVAILKDNQFFGEMALFSGKPRNSTVRAVDLSYLCEFRPEILRQLIMQYPSVKQTMQDYYSKRMKELAQKKREVGFIEKRRHPRFNLAVPISIKVSPSRTSYQLRGSHTFRAITKDISIAGASVRLKEGNEMLLAKLPLGHPLEVALILPSPFDMVKTQATVASVDLPDLDKRRPFGRMGIKFERMNELQRKRLNSYLKGSTET